MYWYTLEDGCMDACRKLDAICRCNVCITNVQEVISVEHDYEKIDGEWISFNRYIKVEKLP